MYYFWENDAASTIGRIVIYIMNGQAFNTKASKYSMFDILRLISAIIVIAIHSGVVNDVSNQYVRVMIYFLESCAVPCFFVISGFLLGEKINNCSQQNVFETIGIFRKKYVKLYLILSMIYFPLTIWGMVRSYIVSDYEVLKIIFYLIRGYFLVGEQFCSWPLWYLLSVMYSTMVLQIAHKTICKKEIGSLLSIAIVFFCLSFVINWFFNSNYGFGVFIILKKALGLFFYNGRLFTGVTYLVLGICIYNWNIEKRTVKILSITAILVSLIVCVVLELGYSTSSITALVTVPIIVKLASFFDIPLNASKARELSKFAYYSHMYFVFSWCYSISSFIEERDKGFRCFVYTTIGVLMIYVMVEVIRKIKKITGKQK